MRKGVIEDVNTVLRGWQLWTASTMKNGLERKDIFTSAAGGSAPCTYEEKKTKSLALLRQRQSSRNARGWVAALTALWRT